MTKYVFDTGPLRKLLDNYPRKGIYADHWEQIENGFKNGTLFSVDEVYEELKKRYDDLNADMTWLKGLKCYFTYPSTDESLFIKELFFNKKFQELIHRKNILENLPSADVFVIARAKSQNATVVTTEEYKPNSSSIPFICEKNNIKCILFEDFMSEFIK